MFASRSVLGSGSCADGDQLSRPLSRGCGVLRPHEHRTRLLDTSESKAFLSDIDHVVVGKRREVPGPLELLCLENMRQQRRGPRPATTGGACPHGQTHTETQQAPGLCRPFAPWTAAVLSADGGGQLPGSRGHGLGLYTVPEHHGRQAEWKEGALARGLSRLTSMRQ